MKNEQDILDVLKEKMEEVEVPESLKPEQIEKKLLEMNPPKEGKQKKKKLYYYSGLAAACLVLAAGIYTIGNYRGDSKVIEDAAMVEEEKPEEVQLLEKEVKNPLKTASSYDDVYPLS